MIRPVRAARCVVLLSGGLDSAANLAFCDDDKKPVLALTVDYGQRAAVPEIEASRALCEYYRVTHRTLCLPWLGELGGSSLTDSSKQMPELSREQLDRPEITRESAHAVWVPNRNGVLIHVAAAFAESSEASEVIVGFNKEEAATFPDNSLEYLKRVNEALSLSTSTRVQVRSYTVEWNKAEMVGHLRNLRREFPFEHVWSCYFGGSQRCGRCESCRRFARAIERV
ncbi:MAG: 7-cyano-7-deazaguanine synthase QueC [Bdellovibrionales bacterium GWB1_55_8]|nr:MAG: 7-cyano-7-deazaguanine synthase QueC [Bdellovibrionales bacterium GWB1_55_8]